MYEKQMLVFLYAISPIHMGSGSALGVIDNPIQRERHTDHPVLAGSGLKGALRESAKEKSVNPSMISTIFGPEPKRGEGTEHAGAISFSDGQIVAFPVRSLKEAFVYVTCPLAIERLKRLSNLAGIQDLNWNTPCINDSEALVLDERLLSNARGNRLLILETYGFKPKKDKEEAFRGISEWIADHALPEPVNEGTLGFFREKLKKHLVLLSDTQFCFFVRNSTVVEPHVRINDITGTAEEGALFFTENVPPESIFVSLAMVSRERKKKGDGASPMSAEKIAKELIEKLDKSLIQIGGDATTGRGQVFITFLESKKEGTNDADPGTD